MWGNAQRSNRVMQKASVWSAHTVDRNKTIVDISSTSAATNELHDTLLRVIAGEVCLLNSLLALNLFRFREAALSRADCSGFTLAKSALACEQSAGFEACQRGPAPFVCRDEMSIPSAPSNGLEC